MKRKTKLLGAIIAASLFLLAACGGSAADATPTIDPGMVYTQAVETAYSQLTQTALAMPLLPTDTPTLQGTPTPLGPTNTPLITDTPAGAQTTAAGLNLPGPRGTATQQTCDNFALVQDISIPDYTVMAAGQNFDKIWEIENLGPCTWNTKYNLVWAYGDWSGTAPVALYYDVPPGDTIQMWVNLTAPTAPGTYFAAFVMQNDRGTNFGIYSPLTVFIVVEATPTP